VLDTGEMVNRIGFTFPVWRIIKGHPGLLKRPFFNQAGTLGYRMTLKDFAALFDEWVEPGACRVYRGVYNANPSPNEDDPKDVKLFFGPGMVAAYVKETPDLEDLSFAKEFKMFAGLDGNDPMVVMQLEDKEIFFFRPRPTTGHAPPVGLVHRQIGLAVPVEVGGGDGEGRQARPGTRRSWRSCRRPCRGARARRPRRRWR
jgi:hypothetical protein